MRISSTAGRYVASTLGLLVLSGAVQLNAQLKALPQSKQDKNAAPQATNFSHERNIANLSYESFELTAGEQKLSADELVRNAVDSNKKASYEKAIAFYLAALAKFEKIAPRNATVERKINNCKEAISRCYFYWAEQLYNEALVSADAKQFDDAIAKCTKAAEIWPASKNKMQDAIAKFQKMKGSAEYLAGMKEETVLPETKDRAFSTELLMRQADALYAEGLWTLSRDKYEQVLSIDPFNAEAIAAVRKTNRKLIETGERRKNVTRQQIIAEAIWTPVIPLIPRESHSAPDALKSDSEKVIIKEKAAQSINERLDSIIIPSLEFEGELITEVLKALQARSYEMNNNMGVNIVYLPYNGQVATTGEGGAAAENTDEDKTISILTGNVSLRDVIQSICNMSGLKYKIEDHAVVIAPKGAPLDDYETHIFTIEKDVYDNFANKGSLKDCFSELGIVFGDRAGVKYISGRLIVTHTPENIKKIKKFLDENDKSEAQILVETKFMEVSLNDIEELGFQYQVSRQASNTTNAEPTSRKFISGGQNISLTVDDFGGATTSIYKKADGKYQYLGTVSPGESVAATGNQTYYYSKSPVQHGGSQLVFGPNSANLVRNVNDIGSRTVMDGLFSAQYTNYDNGLSISGAVRAIDQSDSADVLFCPRITTTNNYPASIEMVTRKYFPTDWEEADVGTIASGGKSVPLFTSSIPELEEEKIGVRLEIQPKIDANKRTITLPLKPYVREHVGWVDYSYPVTVSVEENVSETFTNIIRMPIFEDRLVQTLVSCDDGETIILGGVVYDTTNSVDDQYPILGDIPLIGRLFQSKAKVSEKKNLLIFMTCRMINPDGSPVRERAMRGLPPFRQ